MVGSYDAAVVTKDASGNVHQNKDETATREGAWWGTAAGATVGLIFPPSIIAGAAVGAVSGHLAKGMSRSDAQQLGDFIDPGQAALVVVGEDKVEDAIKKAAVLGRGDRVHGAGGRRRRSGALDGQVTGGPQVPEHRVELGRAKGVMTGTFGRGGRAGLRSRAGATFAPAAAGRPEMS